MANVIKLRNSGTANAAPTSLEVGELAVNYADGILYYKNSSNAISILSSALSAQGASSIEISTTPPASPSSGDLWFESDTGKQFIYYDSFWVEISGADGADGSNAAATTDASLLISGTLPDARLSSAIARIASPTFTGVPAAPTANASTNTTQIATTAFVTTADSLKANIASPTFTGTPLAPTANANTNTTQIATTAFVTDAVSTGLASAVINALDDVSDVTITTATNGDLLKWNGTAWVNASGYALLSSPALTGTPTAPTATQATNTTQVATTAFVRAEVAALVNSAGATLDTLGEIATALGNDAALSTTLTTSIGLKAPLANPTFTGTVSGITKTMVGLGSVDNTTDLGKPISNATQTALDLKAPLANATFTGTIVLPATTSIANVTSTEIEYLDGVTSAIQTQLNTKASTGKAIAMAIVFGG